MIATRLNILGDLHKLAQRGWKQQMVSPKGHH